ncbi:hypothetical protein N0614_09595 [Pseudomonas aeruginosa]|nr:hypothetical protein [Pseudomonas aeruginosa]
MNKPMKKDRIYQTRKEILKTLAAEIWEDHWELEMNGEHSLKTVSLKKQLRTKKFLTHYMHDKLKREMRYDQFVTLKDKTRSFKASSGEIESRNYQVYVKLSIVITTEKYMDKIDDILGYKFDLGTKDWTEQELQAVASVVNKEL